MKLIEFLPEPGFEFERAFVANVDGELTAVAVVGGYQCRIETKPTLLEIGVASCIPILALLEVWPLSVRIELEDGEIRTLEEATADPAVVAAAKRFNELAAADQLRDGQPL